MNVVTDQELGADVRGLIIVHLVPDPVAGHDQEPAVDEGGVVISVTRKASCWRRRCELADAFRWEYSGERLELAQILRQLGVVIRCTLLSGSAGLLSGKCHVRPVTTACPALFYTGQRCG